MPRIVGGRVGGRRLVVPAGRTVRPTSERVREALASALEAGLGGLDGRTVLDAYAGSGAVALELLSRGAASATLVEADAGVRRTVNANVTALGLRGAEIVGGKAETVLAGLVERGSAYDIVFLDPPYAAPLDDVLPLAAALTKEVLVIERATRSGAVKWPDGFTEGQTRRYGDSTLWYGWRS
jgi:16S rRNA (guanine966-N2)-methyltransferase